MKKMYALAVILALTTQVKAQYTLEQSSEPYKELENATSITNGLIWEELEADIPIGFTFKIGTYPMDHLYLKYASIESLFLPGVDFNKNMPAICGVIAEYADRNALSNEMIGEPGGVSDVSYVTVGEPGNRILKIQYKNVGFENDIFTHNTSQDYVNFQVWLYEKDYKITYHFGESHILSPEVAFEDVPGPAIGVFSELHFETDEDGLSDFYPVNNAYFIIGDTSSAHLSSLTAADLENPSNVFFNGFPTNGTKYTLTPNDMGVQNVNNKKDYAVLPYKDQDLRLNSIQDVKNISLYTSEGKLVKQWIPQNTLLPTYQLPTGAYYLLIETDKGKNTVKFLKK